MDSTLQPTDNINSDVSTNNNQQPTAVVSIIKEPDSPKTPNIIPEKKLEKKPNRHSILKTFIFLILIVIIGITFWQRQNIIDWYALRNYKAPSDISQLADQAYLSDYGRKIFYINKPQVQDKKPFYISCERGETAIVLGCYVPKKGIYLLQVTDTRLDGVEQVTAAHEMLHAAYGRLSFSKKKQVDQWVEQAYLNVKDDNFIKKVNVYKKSGADVDNELHSMLGTEIKDLPPELADYYQQYFKDRTKVVELSDKYQAEFTARKLKVEELDKQLATIEAQILANNKQLDDLEKSINNEKSRLDNLLQNDLVDEYNSGVEAYNQSLIPYRNLLSQTKGLVSQYKDILNERNTIALEAQELNKELDSRISAPNDVSK